MDTIRSKGVKVVWGRREELGYSKTLHPIRSRSFVLAFHTEGELSVVVRDAVQTDLDNKTNCLILEQIGSELDNKNGVKLLYSTAN